MDDDRMKPEDVPCVICLDCWLFVVYSTKDRVEDWTGEVVILNCHLHIHIISAEIQAYSGVFTENFSA